MLFTTVTATAASPEQASASCSSILIRATDWLGGQGVNVYGCGYQCVELAARLYSTRGWPTVHTADGGAHTIPEGSPGLDFFPNGSGYVPVPGDLIVEEGDGGANWYGHVSVVDTVTSTTIKAAEQNASSTGWHTYQRTGSNVTGGYNGPETRKPTSSPSTTTERAAPRCTSSRRRDPRSRISSSGRTSPGGGRV